MSLGTTFLALAVIGGAAVAPAQTARVALASTTTSTHASATAPCAAPAQTGTFRVTATKPDGSGVRPAMIVLENINGCLEATLITDEASPAVIDHLSFSGDTLTGMLRTGGGVARIALSFDAAGVAGSITDGRQQWLVKGRRTS
jgi:hypothetical protein